MNAASATSSVGRRGIAAAGLWIVDHCKVIEAWPEQDGLVSILGHTSGNGGGAYNVLKDLARLGAPFPCEAIGLIGADADGDRIVADCRAANIDCAQLHRTPSAPTSYTDVMTVRGSGRRTFFHHRGANSLLSAAHFDFPALRARHLHYAYPLLLDVLDAPGPDDLPAAVAVLRAAAQAGFTVSVDCVSTQPERFSRVVRPLLPHTDIFFANDFEAAQLTDQPVDCPDSLASAARQIIDQGVRQWVIVHSPFGACAAAADGRVLHQASVALPAAEIVGTAGAGDAFAAGVLFGWHEAWEMERALLLGVTAAAASLRDASCSAGIVPWSECLRLADTHGVQPQFTNPS